MDSENLIPMGLNLKESTFNDYWIKLTEEQHSTFKKNVIDQASYLFGYSNDDLDLLLNWMQIDAVNKNKYLEMAGKKFIEGGDMSLRIYIILCALNTKLKNI